jgi:uncharacterized SAM-binding protein YcdF (DUF218 family)
MFFFLSKTLSYLTTPLVIVAGLLIVSLFIQSTHWKKNLKRLAICLLLFFSNDFLCNEIVLLWEVSPIAFDQIKKKYEYGILLTGVTKSETPLTDRVFLNRGADRITHTLQLYRMGIIKKILISGGNGNLEKVKKQEADNVADVLLLMGVPDSVITIENVSRNTHESAVEINKRFKGQVKPSDCLLITSAFHIRRSYACFAHEGWPVDTFSTDLSSHPRKFTFDTLFIPKTEAMGNWQLLIKEWIGLLAYKIAGYI